MYPNKTRSHLTTNDELFLNNQGNFKAKPNGFNIFAGSFKIDQNSYDKQENDANTVYRDDFLKTSLQQSAIQRGEIMTKYYKTSYFDTCSALIRNKNYLYDDYLYELNFILNTRKKLLNAINQHFKNINVAFTKN